MNANEKAIVSVTTLSHAMVHTYELSIPILMTLWLAQFGLTEASIGALVTVGYGLFGLGSLPSGMLTDRLGSRQLIGGCLLGMGLAFLLLAVAPNVWIVGLALVLWGLSGSTHHPAALTLLSKGVRKRGEAFGYHGMGGNLGIALGPGLTSVALIFLDWRMISVLLAVPALLAGWYAFTLSIDEREGGEEDVEDDPGPGELWSGFFRNSRTLLTSLFIVVASMVLVSGIYYRGVLTFFPEILADLPYLSTVEVMGRELHPAHYVYSGLLSVGVLGQYLGGKLYDHIVPEKGLVVIFATLSVLVLLFGPISGAGLVPLLVISALLGLVLFMAQPLYQATVARYTTPETRGLAYGYTFFGAFGIGALGASLAGFMMSVYGTTALFLMLAGIASINIFIAGFLAYRRIRHSSDSRSVAEGAG